MTTHRSTPVRGARRRIAAVACVVSVLSAFAVGFAALDSPAAGRADVPMGYRWPVQPFDEQHPVRGGFSDPRTIFSAAATAENVLYGPGTFDLHRGIDISARNGAEVYPVVSGRVTEVHDEWIRVDSAGGRAFEYWHIHPQVRLGDSVDAYDTVIGHVMPPAAHVHLTELDDGHPINPLQPGHLGPYIDNTTPQVTSITFRRSEAGRELLPNALHGRVIIVAGAEDAPAIDAPAAWRGLPVSPALLTWEVRTLAGKAAVERQIAIDARNHLPRAEEFWRVYVRGTYQNMAAFRGHYSWGQRGSYLFRLAPDRFDTRGLPNGAYDLVVTATDIQGNASTRIQRFAIAN